MLSFFFTDVFQDRFSGHQHHSTTKWSPFAGFPILAKLFSIEGTGRTLAIAIGVVLILGFEWKARAKQKPWDIGMWALHGTCWYRCHGATWPCFPWSLTKVCMFESFHDFVPWICFRRIDTKSNWQSMIICLLFVLGSKDSFHCSMVSSIFSALVLELGIMRVRRREVSTLGTVEVEMVLF